MTVLCSSKTQIQNARTKLIWNEPKHTHKMSSNSTTSGHLLTCRLIRCGSLKSLPQKPQQNFLTSEWTTWCCLNSPDVQKHFEQWSQTYGFTPSCRCMCSLRWPLRLNHFWQMWHVNQVPSLCDFDRCDFSWRRHLKHSAQCLHENGFATVWTETWLLRPFASVNRLPQTEQWNGFFPEWILLCTLNCELCRKDFPHSLHLYGFSPLWILPCSVKLSCRVNRLPQTQHSNGFSPEWVRPCLIKAVLPRKHFPHSLHLCLLLWIYICILKLLQLV